MGAHLQGKGHKLQRFLNQSNGRKYVKEPLFNISLKLRAIKMRTQSQKHKKQVSQNRIASCHDPQYVNTRFMKYDDY